MRFLPDCIEMTADCSQILLALYRQYDLARIATEQLNAKKGLEALDLSTYGTGRHEQFLGGTTYALQSAGCFESSQRVQRG
ncbi:hypothetical protein AGR13a_Lc30065 [Agrobacterium genomosp. 13 str. CFBP 6927]|uniref:Uncharacterized protein n=1 Tax=Agrobacterium genomosp. 13 str. CFBP 6927 TaxID=1183428 RepID=A0ABM9VLC2_9HYPH|nr:hypothetical protein AGR13a_Lc30065 [Agrobacterium genomosp. 13 str. CFBP 6927]